MACIASWNLGQILVWLFVPTPIEFTCHDAEEAPIRIWLFRIYRPHAQLLDLIDQAQTKAWQSRGTHER